MKWDKLSYGMPYPTPVDTTRAVAVREDGLFKTSAADSLAPVLGTPGTAHVGTLRLPLRYNAMQFRLCSEH